LNSLELKKLEQMEEEKKKILGGMGESQAFEKVVSIKDYI